MAITKGLKTIHVSKTIYQQLVASKLTKNRLDARGYLFYVQISNQLEL